MQTNLNNNKHYIHEGNLSTETELNLIVEKLNEALAGDTDL